MKLSLQELRLGNIIRHNVKDDEGNYCEPNEAPITEDDMWHFVGGVGLGDAEAVELTEEWLKKSGFEILDHDMRFFDKRIARGDCNSFVIRVWFNKQWYLGIYGHDGGVGIPINYIHELQNIYYALSGTELQ